MNIRIFSGAWGNYVDILERACGASLSWPRNMAAIKGATWTVVSEEKHFDQITKIRERCGVFRGELIALHSGQDVNQQFSGHLYREMQNCIDTDSVFLFALPDYVFGDGTIPNLLSMMIEPGLCLAVPNTRVLPSAMEEFKRPLTNAQLVSVAFDPGYMHQTWRDAEVGKDTINSFYGGVHWKEIEPGLIVAGHRLPSSYMCKFLQSDIEYFKKQLNFSAWDHCWGAELVRDGRQRFIGSSDVAFITEITEANKNNAIVTPVSPKGPSDFFRTLLHNKINQNISTVFRKG